MLRNKKLFLFDIDGTLAVGSRLFEGTKEVLSYIRKIGGEAIFITNNSTKNRVDYQEKFLEWEIKTEPYQFVTSGFLTIEYLKKYYSDKRIYAMGTRSFIDELYKEGLDVTEEVKQDLACAVVGYDNELTYSKVENTCKVLSENNIPFIATNPDLCCPAPFGFIPDCGAICKMIETSVKQKPLYIGKPSKEVVRYCLELTGFTRDDTLVVGDRLYTDIACGINGGVDTYLVLTGEAKKADLKDTPYKPTYYSENIQHLAIALR